MANKPKKPTPRKKTTRRKAVKSYDDSGVWTSLNGRSYGFGQDGYRDEPSNWDLLSGFRGVVYTAVGLITPSVAREVARYKLVVRTGPNDARPRSPVKSLTYATKASISEHYPDFARRAVDVDEVADHALLDLLDRPNRFQSFRKLVELISQYLEIVGSSFVHVERSQLGVPVALYVLPSQCVRIVKDSEGRLLHYAYSYQSGKPREFEPDEIIHFRAKTSLEDPYNEFGYSPTKAVWDDIRLLYSETMSWQSVLDSMTFPTVIVTPPEGTNYTPNQAQRLEKQLLEKGRLGGNQGGLWVAQDGIQFNPFQPPLKDLSALQVYQSLRTRVSGAFHVPLSLLDLSGEANASSDTSETVRRNFQRYCLLPRIEDILETLTHALCPPRMRLISETTISPDRVFELQKVTALVSSDVMTINEARQANGLEPLKGMDVLHSVLSPNGTPSAQTFQNSAPVPVTKAVRVRYTSSHPNAEPLEKALRGVFTKFAGQFTDSTNFVGKALKGLKTKSFVPLEQWTAEMRAALVPVLRVYMADGAEGVLGAVGGGPEIRRHAVQHLDDAVNGLVLALADSTLSTTSKSVEDAVEATRDAIRGGLAEGEADADLAKRIGAVFEDLSERRSRLIAETESSRSKHAGEAIAISAAGVTARKEWLPDSMACPECRAFAAKGAIELDKSFGQFGRGPYSKVDHPPGHPQCRCTMIYDLSSE